MDNVRQYTSKLLEQIDDGMLDKDFVLRTVLEWLSEDDVKEMIERSDLIMVLDEEDDDE